MSDRTARAEEEHQHRGGEADAKPSRACGADYREQSLGDRGAALHADDREEHRRDGRQREAWQSEPRQGAGSGHESER